MELAQLRATRLSQIKSLLVELYATPQAAQTDAQRAGVSSAIDALCAEYGAMWTAATRGGAAAG